MKVLLLGEFSSLHANLKQGLLEHGVDVTTASSGDGWKKIEADINWRSKYSGLIGRFHSTLKLILNLRKFKGYDVVQLIAPSICTNLFGLNRLVYYFVRKNNKKVFIVGAGSSWSNTIVADFFQSEFKYRELYDAILDSHGGVLWSQTKSGRKYNDYVFRTIDGYIPIMYEYAEGYRRSCSDKLCETIPIPISLKEIEYTSNQVGNKLVIFHGLNREKEKGTPIIREAFALIEREYGDNVSLVLDGNMPLEEYLKVIDKANVVIDQLYSVSNSVNGLLNMAKGKVVMGGGEAECIEEFSHIYGDSSTPIIPLKPSVEDVVEKIKNILEKKEIIGELGLISRKYVEKYHDSKTVAEKYLKVWGA